MTLGACCRPRHPTRHWDTFHYTRVVFGAGSICTYIHWDTPPRQILPLSLQRHQILVSLKCAKSAVEVLFTHQHYPAPGVSHTPACTQVAKRRPYHGSCLRDTFSGHRAFPDHRHSACSYFSSVVCMCVCVRACMCVVVCVCVFVCASVYKCAHHRNVLRSNPQMHRNWLNTMGGQALHGNFTCKPCASDSVFMD